MISEGRRAKFQGATASQPSPLNGWLPPLARRSLVKGGSRPSLYPRQTQLLNPDDHSRFLLRSLIEQ
jgi:hypothetical protein